MTSERLALFECLCSQGALTVDDLPTTCPGHGKPRTAYIHENYLDGPMNLKHWCHSETPCNTHRMTHTHPERLRSLAHQEESA